MKLAAPILALAAGLSAVLLTVPHAQAASAVPDRVTPAVMPTMPSRSDIAGRIDDAAAIQTQGGQTVYPSSGVPCTLGFNVRSGTTYYFLALAFCAGTGATWYADAGHTIELGVSVATSGAITLVRYTNPGVTPLGGIAIGGGFSVDITYATSPYVGQRVCRPGMSSGVYCGTVTALNQTVDFGNGTILYGLAKTTVCRELGGLNGPPFFSGTAAIGIGVGGSGSCETGGITYVQLITSVLGLWGLNVY